MSDSLPTTPPPPAPHTMILGYFSRTAGPTRVRRIAAVGLLVLAVLDTGLAATLALILRGPMLEHIHESLYAPTFGLASGPYSFVRAAPTWTDWARAVAEACWELLIPLLLLAVFALFSLLLTLCTVGVYRGRRWACRIALAPAVVHLLLFILCSAAMLALMIFGLVDDGGLPSWRTMLMLALGLLSGLLALLMIDLCAFLRWIARTPDANPPPRKFV